MACLPCQSRWASVSAALTLEPASRTKKNHYIFAQKYTSDCMALQNVKRLLRSGGYWWELQVHMGKESKRVSAHPPSLKFKMATFKWQICV